MSPQSRAAANATLVSRDDGCSGNACPASSSVAALARAANFEYALHKIESDSSAATQAIDGAHAQSPSLSRKRASSCITDASTDTESDSPQFLSSYGSAFLSGIFADIAQAIDEPQDDQATSEPSPKKVRTGASTSLRGLKSHAQALSDLANGGHAAHEVSSPSVLVSPRPNTSANSSKGLLNQPLNAQIQQLQDLAFPSLPHLPMAVSSGSFSSASQVAVPSPRTMGEGCAAAEDDSPESYGWFVSMDGDDEDAMGESPAPSGFLPSTEPALAFKALPAAPLAVAGEQDVEVQQALAADTIDDVLGDLF